MKDTRAIRAIERQLVLEQGENFDIRRNFPVLAVLIVSSLLFFLVQFYPQLIFSL